MSDNTPTINRNKLREAARKEWVLNLETLTIPTPPGWSSECYVDHLVGRTEYIVRQIAEVQGDE